MSSAISPTSSSDDLLDFILAHHTKEERGARCYSLMGRNVCCRCAGWVPTAIATGVLALAGALTYSWWAYFLPIPAFIDWGGRKLGFLKMTNKWSALASGAVMGVSIPYFYMGAFALDPRTFAIAAGYFALYAVIQFGTRNTGN